MRSLAYCLRFIFFLIIAELIYYGTSHAAGIENYQEPGQAYQDSYHSIQGPAPKEPDRTRLTF